MEVMLSSSCRFAISDSRDLCQFQHLPRTNYRSMHKITPMDHSGSRIYSKKLSKMSHRYPRRIKLPPELGINTFLKKNTEPLTNPNRPQDYETPDCLVHNDDKEGKEWNEVEDAEIVWEEDEVDAISSLFKGRVPQKPGKLNRERPPPLPMPCKLRPLGLPTPKKRAKASSSSAAALCRQSVSEQVYKNPQFLIDLARDIRSLSPDEDVSSLLSRWAQFLRKGSLSLTIRELGHMGLPDRALQVFCWAQEQQHLFPYNRILASTVEVLARAHELKMPFNLEQFISLASQGEYEAAIKGFIKGGNLRLAWKLLSAARNGKRMLDCSVYAKTIFEFGKNPDRYPLVLILLEDLAESEDLNLTQQDCTAIMKVCIRLGKFELVEDLFNWFKQGGRDPSVVMYTTLIHGRYSEKKYREALGLVWEMETSNCLFDLPAYRMVIKLFVALNDLPRTVRYFAKLKEAGFSPTYDIYCQVIRMYMVSGRLAKCKDVCEEAERAGFKLDKETRSRLLQLER